MREFVPIYVGVYQDMFVKAILIFGLIQKLRKAKLLSISIM